MTTNPAGTSTGKMNFNYFKISGVDIDISKIKTLDIYESIEFPGITGSVLIDDWFSLRETLNIFAGDIVNISFGRVTDKSLDLELVITSAPIEIPLKNQDDKYLKIDFCSKWLVEGFTQKRSRVWKNEYIHDIVADLVEMCGGNLGIFVKTKQKLERFVSPYWSPIQTIRYLMNFAVDQDDVGGYLLFTGIYDKEKESNEIVNFIPYSTLVSTRNYGYVPYKLTLTPRHHDSPERIISMTMGSTFDSIKQGALGLGRTQHVGFNYDKTEVMSQDNRIDQYGHNHISSKLPLDIKYLGSAYRTTKDSLLFPNTKELIEDGKTTSEDNTGTTEEDTYIRNADELLKGRLNTKQSLTFSDAVTLDLMTNGEGYHKKAGKLVWIDYPSRSMQSKREYHKQLSGTYLIKDLRHSINGMIYTNVMTVICDGFKDSPRPDLVEWTKESEYAKAWDVSTKG